ncbi:MAG TPA: hypothetical protein VG756_12585 [Pseudonocardiaceae bacterium]|nr:hypothetical protein [Pseudonocardiaceae bacterium]
MDPFGTASLRESVLVAWRESPTRFREDANTEEDLKLGGYRDRLLVELAQNAADAAILAQQPGRLKISLVDNELRAANTGAPLDASGVAGLASLRASAKRAGDQVGRFGVGFAAVLAVTDAPRVVSTSGGVAFSAERTRAEVPGETRPEVPVLRLIWPVDDAEPPVPQGFDTEVRLPLRADIDQDLLLADLTGQAADLLLALPGLRSISVGQREWSRGDEADGRVTLRGPDGATEWLTRRSSGRLSGAEVDELGVEARERPEWSVCWAIPLDADGAPTSLPDHEVLCAPTPTDERLSLPARLFATLPVESTRRRLLPGKASDSVLAAAGREFVELVRSLPMRQRTALVPEPGFPLSEVDGRLRDAITAGLTENAWLPTELDGRDRSPAGAVVLDVPDEALGESLAQAQDGLLAWWLAEPVHARALATLGVRRLRPVDLVEAVAGLRREPSWWAGLYAALDRVAAADPDAIGEFGALPVPLVDGRTVLGPRDVLLPSAHLADQLSEVDIVGLRVAHPDAVHPLLERLGARPADAVDLLAAPAIREAVEASLADARAGADPIELATAVLNLVDAARIDAGELPWLGALALPGHTGEPRRADELVLPDSPLREVLAAEVFEADGPLGILDTDLAADWPAEVLAAVGVLRGFVVVRQEDPSGPDHELADEADWWDWIEGDLHPPATLVGVRDLDLVDDDAWPAAIRLLAADPDVRRALADPRGYPAWWLGRFAVLDGRPPVDWRLAGAEELTGLYDPVPELGLDADLLRLLGVRTELAADDAPDATDLLDRLGDPDREIPGGLAVRVHAELAEAVATQRFSAEDVEPPERVRVLTGATAAAEDAVILDRPWLFVFGEDRIVAAVDGDDNLAELLNVSLASELITDAPDPGGDAVAWAELGAVRLACELLDSPAPEGTVVVHDELTVGPHRVSWWVEPDADGEVVHAEDTPDGLARALAWVADRWADRHLFAALLEDPTAATLLR